MTDTATLTIADFLLARIAEVADCDGTGEYRRCHDLSEWAERTADAQRRIVEMHHQYLGVCTHCVDPQGEHQREGWPCGTLVILAAVYADHPDYRDEWRP